MAFYAIKGSNVRICQKNSVGQIGELLKNLKGHNRNCLLDLKIDKDFPFLVKQG